MHDVNFGVFGLLGGQFLVEQVDGLRRVGADGGALLTAGSDSSPSEERDVAVLGGVLEHLEDVELVAVPFDVAQVEGLRVDGSRAAVHMVTGSAEMWINWSSSELLTDNG